MIAAPLDVALVYDDSLDRPGGIPQYLTTLAGALRRRGHRVALVVGATEQHEVAGCPVHSMSRNVGVRFNGNRLSMPVLPHVTRVRALARQKFDVVHVQVPYSPLMSGLLIGSLPACTAVVGTFHVASERLLPRLGLRLLGVACTRGRRRFDETVCVSNHARRFGARAFGLQQAQIVPNMIDLRIWETIRAGPTTHPTVAFVGALVPRKGAGVLLEAFARVRRHRPEARLVLAGDGPLRARLYRRAQALNIEDAVELPGRLSEEQKMRLLASARVACFPSRYGESFGIVLLEAMAANGPALLAGANAGYAETLRDLPEALCLPEPGPLADRLAAFLDDDLARRRQRDDHAALLRRFDADRVCEQVLAVYDRALAGRLGSDDKQLERVAA